MTVLSTGGNIYRGEDIEGVNDHGTETVSLLAANAGVNPLLEPPVDNWGMVGVNTVSEVVVMRCHWDGYPGRVGPADLMAQGLYRLAQGYGCDIVYQSLVWRIPQRWYECQFDQLIEEEAMPLFIVSAGNNLVNGVRYPGRYAFIGHHIWDEEEEPRHPNGYPQVMSIGMTTAFKVRADSSSYNPGHNYVSVVAPGEINIRVAVPPTHHGFDNGTSLSAPLVAGAASLVLSAARDADQDLSSWALRRILEKTAFDINIGELPQFDEEIGYGLISCNNAVNNRDIYQWELEDNTWYLISSNVNPVFGDIKRVMEDFTVR